MTIFNFSANVSEDGGFTSNLSGTVSIDTLTGTVDQWNIGSPDFLAFTGTPTLTIDIHLTSLSGGNGLEELVVSYFDALSPPFDFIGFTGPAVGEGIILGPVFSQHCSGGCHVTDATLSLSENVEPTITSDGGGDTAAKSVAENTTAVTTVAADDPHAGQTLTYSIIGGDDQLLFTIDETSGELAFNAAPDFENPADAGGNNVYDVIVQVSDENGGTDSQAIAVSITNVAGLTITGTDNQDTLNGTGEEDSISGGKHKDVLNGLGGNDTLTGGHAKDTFVFAANFGQDVITDFNKDVIQFDQSVFADFSDVQSHVADDGFGNAVITLDADNSLTILGVSTAQLQASDFLFV